MPRRKAKFITGEIYHIVTRAIDDNLIFKDINDYFRGIFSIYEFNNEKPVNISIRRRDRNTDKKKKINLIDLGDRSTHRSTQINFVEERDKFVEILVFCFMPNHIHLLLRQIKDNGISKFMQKVGGGYGKYSNKKQERRGHFFQNEFKSVHIENDRQLVAVFLYIHNNPLSLIEPRFKENGIKNPEKAIKFLEEEYRWSSYFDYIGKKNFPSVTERDFLLEIMDNTEGCKEAMRDSIMYNKKFDDFNNLFIE